MTFHTQRKSARLRSRLESSQELESETTQARGQDEEEDEDYEEEEGEGEEIGETGTVEGTEGEGEEAEGEEGEGEGEELEEEEAEEEGEGAGGDEDVDEEMESDEQTGLYSESGESNEAVLESAGGSKDVTPGFGAMTGGQQKRELKRAFAIKHTTQFPGTFGGPAVFPGVEVIILQNILDFQDKLL